MRLTIIRMKGDASLIPKVSSKIKKVITDSPIGATAKLAASARDYAATRADGFKFTGKLRDSIKVDYQSGKKSIAFIKKEREDVASYNEFGVRPHRVYLKNNPEIEAWARQKAPHFLKRKYVPVGYTHGSSRQKEGRASNWFWLPTVYTINMRVPKIVAEHIGSNLEKLDKI